MNRVVMIFFATTDRLNPDSFFTHLIFNYLQF
jgi:hypothetical protein